MLFLWPHFLWLLLALPLLVLAYVLLLRRRAGAVRFSSVRVARAAAGRAWRRHLPPELLLLACSAMFLAAARPVAHVTLPWSHSTILLAMDVSLSMRVADVQPSRLAAAQGAARSFLQGLPRQVEVGLVTFAGSSQVVQRPTRDRVAVLSAIDAFQMQMGTAVGDAIVLCLAELFPEQRLDLESVASARGGRGRSLADTQRPAAEPTPVAPGSYASAVIILLSDGRRTTGVDTLEAARLAADRGVRIHVVGLGTVDGEALTTDGMPIYLRLDEPTLREVARMTGGEYHHAATAETLRGVYEKLGARIQVQSRSTELTGLLALASALLALAAGLLSVVWFARLA